MCRLLGVSRGMIYYKPKQVKADSANKEIEQHVVKAFKNSRNCYGTRKLKAVLPFLISRRKIADIMRKHGLISKYTLKQYKRHKKSTVNEDSTGNLINRQFDNRRRFEVVVSDLTYVRVRDMWNYICIIVDLYNREIIGWSVGKRKDAELVKQAFARIQTDLRNITVFHTDRGSEFRNQVIDEMIQTFDIQRSLSEKGTPYDNAVNESTYHIIKTEFADKIFASTEELELQFRDYVHWYNTTRVHGSLMYRTPVQVAISCATLDIAR